MSAASAALANAAVASERRAGPAQVVARLAWADVLERTRRPSYLVSLLVMAWLAHGMLPDATAGYRTFSMQDHFRPAYGPEWVGALVGVMSGLYFVLVGFYLVKGAVERDRTTGVGQILAASRVSRWHYVAGKTLSNVAVLSSMLLVALGVALVTQQLLGEDRTFAPFATALPLFAAALPVALVVAAGAVLFECVPWLAGGFGNIAWFVLVMVAMATGIVDAESKAAGHADLLGFAPISRSTFAALHAYRPEVPIDTKALTMGVNISKEWRGVAQQTFPWHGFAWDAALVLGRLSWFGVALMLMSLAALVFDRFDRRAVSRAAAPRGLRAPAWLARFAPVASARAAAPASVAALAPAIRGFATPGLVRAELALLVHGQPGFWWLGIAGLAIATLLAPLDAVRQGLLPVLGIWPVLALSPLGARAKQHGTESLLLSAPRPVTRPLVAAWLAGALVFAAPGLFAMLRFVATGHADLAAGWIAGGALVSALALALGTWTGGGKFFEVLLLFAWYVGPMHHIAELDYTGVTVTRTGPQWLAALVLLAGLLAAAWAGRARRVRG